MGIVVFFLNIGGYIICEAHYNSVSASGLNPRLVCGSGNTICKRVKAFTSCTAVQAQGHSGRRSTGFLLARYVNTDFSRMSRQTKILGSHFVNDSVLLKNIGPGFSIFESRSVTEFLAVIFAVSTA